MPVGLRQIDKPHQRSRFAWRHRPPVSASREIREDSLHAGASRFRIANQNTLPAFLFYSRRERANEDHGVEKFVLLVVVEFRRRESLHEVVVRESGEKDMITYREIQLHFFFGIGIEVNQSARLGFDLFGSEKLSIHPEVQGDRLAVRSAFAR